MGLSPEIAGGATAHPAGGSRGIAASGRKSSRRVIYATDTTEKKRFRLDQGYDVACAKSLQEFIFI
jgi:hypothetical protein